MYNFKGFIKENYSDYINKVYDNLNILEITNYRFYDENCSYKGRIKLSYTDQDGSKITRFDTFDNEGDIINFGYWYPGEVYKILSDYIKEYTYNDTVKCKSSRYNI